MPVRKKTITKKSIKKSVPRKKSKFNFKKILAPFLVLVGVILVLSFTLIPKPEVLSLQVASENSIGNISSLFNQNIKLYSTVLAKNASGSISVDAVEYREWIGGKDRIMFRINGQLTGLVPGTPYQLWLCYNTSNTNCTAQPNGVKADSSGKVIIKNQLLDVVSSTSYKFKVRDVPPSGAALPKDTCSVDMPCLEATFNYVGGIEQSSAPGTAFKMTAVCQTYGHGWLNRGHIDVQVELDNSKNPGKWNTVTLREDGNGGVVRVIGMSPSSRTITGVKYHGNAADAFSQFKDASIIRFEDNKKYILEVWDGDYRSSLPESGVKPFYTSTLLTPTCNIVSTPTPTQISSTTYPTKTPTSKITTPTPTGRLCPAKLSYVNTKTACRPFKSGSTTSATFGCSDGYVGVKTGTTCTSAAAWYSIALRECSKRMTACK